MELSSKSVRFIIEALDYRIKAYEESLDIGNVDSDEASDIANDAMYLEAIRDDLAKTLSQSEQVRVKQVTG
jgi:hypothetical protein